MAKLMVNVSDFVKFASRAAEYGHVLDSFENLKLYCIEVPDGEADRILRHLKKDRYVVTARLEAKVRFPYREPSDTPKGLFLQSTR